MARTDVRSTIKRIRRQARSGHRNEFGALLTSITDSETTITFDADLPKALQPGSILTINLESMRVRTVDRTAKTAVVVRNWDDSESTAHSAGDEIDIDARFSLLDIHSLLIAELDSWGPEIFRVDTAILDTVDGAETAELPVEWIDHYRILTVRRSWTDVDTTRWPAVDGVSIVRAPVDVLPDALTSGLLLRVPGIIAGQMYVAVGGPFITNDLALGSDLVSDVGIPPTSLDLLEMGVKYRMRIDAELGRASRQVQGDARDPAETPVGSSAPDLAIMERQYLRRRTTEQRKLLELWPIRRD